jgi:hypothetical protein
MKASSRIKKAVIIALCGFFCTSGFAQLTVVSNGNVGIGTSNPQSKFAINDSGSTNYAMYVKSVNLEELEIALRAVTTTPSPASTNRAYTSVYGSLRSGNGWAKGLWGESYNSSAQSSGRAYGVYGHAGNATPGYNYGVFGILSGSNNGAGVYGASVGNSDENTGGNYAGYFKGNVYMSSLLSIGNKNTTYAADITGTVRATAFLESSDERLKDDILDLDKSNISTLKKLRGVTYVLKQPEVKNLVSTSKTAGDTTECTSTATTYDSTLYSRRHKGFLAQEVQEVYPELVYEDKEGMLSVDYIGLIPVIVGALKEQDSIISAQNIVIQELKSSLESFDNTKSKNINYSSLKAVLYQNTPNPFSTSTEIQYEIPEEAESAFIYIFNMQGSLVSTNYLSTKGKSSMTINASALKAGMYIYSLIVDGKEVDTKRMILTD